MKELKMEIAKGWLSDAKKGSLQYGFGLRYCQWWQAVTQKQVGVARQQRVA